MVIVTTWSLTIATAEITIISTSERIIEVGNLRLAQINTKLEKMKVRMMN